MSWIGVDLDGTLAYYADWETNGSNIGKPIPAMLDRVKQWLASGTEVRIVTARVSRSDVFQVAMQIEMIEKWCFQHLGCVLPTTCEKDMGMIELWDDRAISVQHNTGRDMRVGATGSFPNGKLRDDDKGGLRIAITALDGNVVIQLGEPTEWLAMPPDVAMSLSYTLAKRARELLVNKKETPSD